MKKNLYLVIVVFICYFAIGFITNTAGPLVPDIIKSFSLSLTLLAVLPFAIFLAYGLFSIPAGLCVERFGEKKMLIAAFILTLLSSAFITVLPTYAASIASLFIIGIGLAILQVSLNPLLREVGGKENYSVNLTIVQIVFGAASYVGPFIYSYFAANLHTANAAGIGPSRIIRLLERITKPGLSWISMYSLFAVFSAVMIILVLLARMPKVELKADERMENISAMRELFKNRYVPFFIVGIFVYVGLEIGVVTWISQFLMAYHGFNPHTTGARAVAWFWGALTGGSVVAVLLLKLFDARRILICASACAICSLCLALFAPGRASIAGFIVLGFFMSSLWPIIYSLAMNTVPEHHGALSGLLVTATAGGAVMPLVVGIIGDRFGLRVGMLVLFFCLLYIAAIGFWAKPLVSNKRIIRGA